MKCVTALCEELHRHETLYSVCPLCKSNGILLGGHVSCLWQCWSWHPAMWQGTVAVLLPGVMVVSGRARAAGVLLDRRAGLWLGGKNADRAGRDLHTAEPRPVEKWIISCPLTVCYNVLNLNLYNQHDVVFLFAFVWDNFG